MDPATVLRGREQIICLQQVCSTYCCLLIYLFVHSFIDLFICSISPVCNAMPDKQGHYDQQLWVRIDNKNKTGLNKVRSNINPTLYNIICFVLTFNQVDFLECSNCFLAYLNILKRMVKWQRRDLYVSSRSRGTGFWIFFRDFRNNQRLLVVKFLRLILPIFQG